MSNCNYTQFSNEELLDAILNIKSNPITLHFNVKKEKPELYFEILNRTKFLDLSELKKPINFRTRIYCIQHNLYEVPKCQRQGCNNIVQWDKQHHQFKHHCSCKCSANDSYVNNKKKETNLTRYGSENPFQSELIKKKISDTMIQRYGFEHALQSEEIMKKFHSTCMKNNGVFSPMESIDIRNKSKETLLLKYGVDNSFKSKEVRDRFNKTMIQRYGVAWAMQSDDIQQKTKDNNIRKIGVEWHLQLNDVREKGKETLQEKYGVDNYTQSLEYHKNKCHRYQSEKYPELTFDSSWEVIVYEFCMDSNIYVEYSPSIAYEYEYDSKVWTYHPDFLINGKVYEVKGEQFFRINESTRQEEMFCPYRCGDWSDEYYQWICGKYEAKHQCMILNNVKILRKSDINNLRIEIFA